MFFTDLLIALVIAVIFSLILTVIFGWRHPAGEEMAGTFLFVFLMFLLFGWMGGIWLTPVGPPLWGSYWVSFIIIPFLVALLLIALAPPTRPPRTRREAVEQAREEEAVESTLGLVFWILLIFMALFIIYYYIR
jgi:MFS family permease